VTAQQWFAILSQIVMWVVAILVFYWGADKKKAELAIAAKFQTERESVDYKFALRDQRLGTLEARVEDAQDRGSREASRVTVRMEELRDRIAKLENHRGR
jgi:hypothetical protein